jgi:hypothetical protein
MKRQYVAPFFRTNSPPWGCRKSQNPLTTEGAKALRKDRKELNINVLFLRPLRIPIAIGTLRALRLKDFFFSPCLWDLSYLLLNIYMQHLKPRTQPSLKLWLAKLAPCTLHLKP